MYKILYLTQFPEIGGGETILLSLLQNLDRKKFEPIVIVPKRGSPRSAGGAGQLFKKLGTMKIKTYFLNLNPYLIRTFFVPGASPVGLWQLIKLCRKIKPDLIHLNHLTLAIYAGIAAKTLRVPVVATAHGSWDCIYFYQDLVNQLLINRVLAITPNLSKNLIKRNIISRSKLSTVSPGVDTDIFKPGSKTLARQKLGLPRNDFIITIVGRLDPVKDHLTFLKAAKIICEKIRNVKFFIVGSKLGDFTGRENNYTDLIENFLNENPRLAGKIIFGGFISHMPLVYQSTDVLVSSSTSESFGLALIEAASCGIPVVATNAGSQSIIVQNGKTGFLVPPQNPALIAQKVVILAKNKNFIATFGKNARRQIETNYNLETYVRNIQKSYLREIERGKS